MDSCSYLKAQNRLLDLVRRQENRHKLLAQSAQSDSRAGDLCDMLASSVPADELQVCKRSDAVLVSRESFDV